MKILDQNDVSDLCDYCPLEKKGAYNEHNICYGSRCDEAYDNYVDDMFDMIEDKRKRRNYVIFCAIRFIVGVLIFLCGMQLISFLIC